jgi:outer membrane immunogenic protein
VAASAPRPFNPAVLVYATGGFAYGRENITDNMRVTNAFGTVVEQFPFSTSSTKTGWTVGGGLEWMFAHNWSIRAEYLYVQLDANGGQVLNTAVLGPSALATDAMRLDTGRDKLNIVRVGVDYKFDWAGPGRSQVLISPNSGNLKAPASSGAFFFRELNGWSR